MYNLQREVKNSSLRPSVNSNIDCRNIKKKVKLMSEHFIMIHVKLEIEINDKVMSESVQQL